MPHKDPEAARAWRRKWWAASPAMREKQNARSRVMKAKINSMLRDHKLAAGCADCGYSNHHAALEFHHVGDDKEINLSFAKSIAQAKREMAKCEVLCSNCHRLRHWNENELTCKPDIFAATYDPAHAG
jgi:hypothetical protein